MMLRHAAALVLALGMVLTLPADPRTTSFASDGSFAPWISPASAAPISNGASEAPPRSDPVLAHLLSERPSVADMPFTVRNDDCGLCNDGCSVGFAPFDEGHAALGPASGPYTEGGGWHSHCVAGSCDDNHTKNCLECVCQQECEGTCAHHEPFTAPWHVCMASCLNDCEGGCEGGGEGLALVDVPHVWGAVRSRQMHPAEVARSYTNVDLNLTRAALQFFDCSGRLIRYLSSRMRRTPVEISEQFPLSRAG